MSVRRLLLMLWLLCCWSALSGCGQSTSSNTEVLSDNDALLNELLGDLDSVPATVPDPETESSAAEPAVNEPAEPVIPVTKSGQEARLELRLAAGDRFPLIKTIRQTLVQKSAEFPANAQSQLELQIVIQVDDVQPDAILMNVQYTRIRYSHDINGQSLAYDSETHQHAVPADVLPYAGMVNNGFAFWLGRDNRIRELVGYQDFLQRCVQAVPVERRQNLLAEISARFGDDGVANFVDDSVGLLPYNTQVSPDAATQVAVGDVWYRESRLMHPVPVFMKSTCRLLSLNNDTAEVDITGRIASADTSGGNAPGQANVQIRDGRSMGSCLIDRATGLPLKLNRSRYLNMIVTTEDGRTVEQDKRIETTIQTFPNMRGPVVNVPGLPVSVASRTVSQPQTSAPSMSSGSPAGRPSGNAGQITPAAYGVSPFSEGARAPGRSGAPGFDSSNLQSTVRAVYPE